MKFQIEYNLETTIYRDYNGQIIEPSDIDKLMFSIFGDCADNVTGIATATYTKETSIIHTFTSTNMKQAEVYAIEYCGKYGVNAANIFVSKI